MRVVMAMDGSADARDAVEWLAQAPLPAATHISVITAILALYLNVFVLVIQSFIKIPALHALAPAVPPAGPVFGAVQGVVLLAFVAAGWVAVKARPAV